MEPWRQSLLGNEDDPEIRIPNTSLECFLEGVLLGQELYALMVHVNRLMAILIVTIIDLQSRLLSLLLDAS